MTSINDKLGIKRAGKRAMMKLPADRRLRNAITSAKCPQCSHTGARLSGNQTELWCSWCMHRWPLVLPEEP